MHYNHHCTFQMTLFTFMIEQLSSTGGFVWTLVQDQSVSIMSLEKCKGQGLAIVLIHVC